MTAQLVMFVELEPLPIRPGNVEAYEEARVAWGKVSQRYDRLRTLVERQTFFEVPESEMSREELADTYISLWHAANVMTFIWNCAEDISYLAAVAFVEAKFESGEYR